MLASPFSVPEDGAKLLGKKAGCESASAPRGADITHSADSRHDASSSALAASRDTCMPRVEAGLCVQTVHRPTTEGPQDREVRWRVHLQKLDCFHGRGHSAAMHLLAHAPVQVVVQRNQE